MKYFRGLASVLALFIFGDMVGVVCGLASCDGLL
uniref:Uncharacterized protein n=1 Tax=Serratia phage Spe5P4 TaxID=3159438 RepID=A0AAU7VHF7_9CAUD